MQVLSWNSKVQYKRSTPYIGLIKPLREKLPKDSTVLCTLCIDNNEVYVKVLVEPPYYGYSNLAPLIRDTSLRRNIQ